MAEPPVDVPVAGPVESPFSAALAADPSSFCYYFAVVNDSDQPMRIPIGNAKISIFDGMVFLFVAIILIFFAIRLPASIKRFQQKRKSTLQKAYYALMWVSLSLREIRFVLYWTVWNNDETDKAPAKISWIVFRTLVWAVEVSVLVSVVFSTTKRFLLLKIFSITAILALVQAAISAVLIFKDPPLNLQNYDASTAVFWAINEGLLAACYAVICILRCAPACHRFVPGKKSFYWYAGALLLTHALSVAGYLVRMYETAKISYCILNLSLLVYYVAFIPLFYMAFMYSFLHGKVRNTLRQYMEYDESDASDVAISTNSSYQSIWGAKNDINLSNTSDYMLMKE